MPFPGMARLTSMLSTLKSGGFPLRWLLTAYGLLVALPLLLLLGVFFERASTLERRGVEERLLLTAGDLADDIDRDIERRLTTLRVLATMSSLVTRDWATFHERAKAALREEAYVIVLDRDLRQLVNTFVPYGTQPAVTNDPGSARRALASGEPVVSDLFFSLVTKGPVYNILLPVKENGRVEFVLILGIEATHLQPILKGQQLAEGWVSSVWDNNDVVLASSQWPALVGEKLPAPLSRSTIGSKGLMRSIALGTQGFVWRAVVASRLSGWRLSVAAPVALVEGPLRRSRWVWGVSGLLAALVSLLSGAVIGRLLTSNFDRLRQAASALGEGKPLPPQTALSVTEAALVRDVLAQSRKEIDKREERLKRIFEADAVGILIFHAASGALVNANDAFLRMSGYSRADVESRTLTWHVMTPPEYHALSAQQMEQLQASGRAGPYEKEYLFKDGRRSWMLFAGRDLGDGTVVEFAMDIADRKRTEQALRESEATFRAMFEIASVGKMQTHPETGAMLRVNAAMTRLTGYGEQELLDRSVFDITHPQDRAKDREQLQLLREGQIPNYEGEKRYVRKDGTHVWVHVSVNVIRDADGKALRNTAVVQDISARRDAEERQTVLMRELAHRGRNLLAVVKSIAKRTFDGRRSLEEARAVFAGRIQALAGSFGTLTEERPDGTGLREVLATELAAFGTRARVDGPDIRLTAKASQTFALLVHELATNAAKYGALSTREGFVNVRWDIEYPDGAAQVRFEWTETGGPVVKQPQQTGFGTLLINQIVGSELGTTPKTVFARDGFRYCLIALLDRLGSTPEAGSKADVAELAGRGARESPSVGR